MRILSTLVAALATTISACVPSGGQSEGSSDGDAAKAAQLSACNSKTWTNVVACGLALVDAEKQGLVAQSAEIPPPWKFTSTPATNGARRVSCEAVDATGSFSVVVDLTCDNMDQSRCRRLVAIKR